MSFGSVWAQNVAKWSAIVVLGLASIGGVAWSVWQRPHARDVVRAPEPVLMATSPTRTAHGSAPRSPSSAPSSEPIASGGLLPAGTVAAAAVPAGNTVSTPGIEAEVPRATKPEPSVPASLTKKINVNTATAAELELLPGIGPALAARIVEHRTTKGRFVSVDQLDQVKGIGPAKMAKLRPMATVE